MAKIRSLSVAIIISSILLSFGVLEAAQDGTTVATPRLIVQNKAGILSQEKLESLAQKADKTLLEILKIWSIKPKIQKLGKIILEVTPPPVKNASGAVFYLSKESGRKVRTVRLYGVDGQSRGLAHKLTHAIFPHKDKLIRNMMGIYSEKLLGNPYSFPMCGFSSDTWSQVLLKLNSMVPLASLGPDHLDWGMKFQDKKPIVLDQKRRHAAYAQAGSFGEYLIRTYRTNNVKKFYRLSLTTERPWKEAFGVSLDELEAGWISHLNSQLESNAKDVAALQRLMRKDPDTACTKARELAR
jgi:hypothetical protein